jgi:hypothetical protein
MSSTVCVYVYSDVVKEVRIGRHVVSKIILVDNKGKHVVCTRTGNTAVLGSPEAF